MDCNLSIVNECFGGANDLDVTVDSENDNERASMDYGHDSDEIDEKMASNQQVNRLK